MSPPPSLFLSQIQIEAAASHTSLAIVPLPSPPSPSPGHSPSSQYVATVAAHLPSSSHDGGGKRYTVVYSTLEGDNGEPLQEPPPPPARVLLPPPPPPTRAAIPPWHCRTRTPSITPASSSSSSAMAGLEKASYITKAEKLKAKYTKKIDAYMD